MTNKQPRNLLCPRADVNYSNKDSNVHHWGNTMRSETPTVAQASEVANALGVSLEALLEILRARLHH